MDYNSFDAALLRAYDAMQRLSSAITTHPDSYSKALDRYHNICLDAWTHPAWNDKGTLDACMRLFQQNPSSENWVYLTAAMTVYQWANKNQRKETPNV